MAGGASGGMAGGASGGTAGGMSGGVAGGASGGTVGGGVAGGASGGTVGGGVAGGASGGTAGGSAGGCASPMFPGLLRLRAARFAPGATRDGLAFATLDGGIGITDNACAASVPIIFNFGRSIHSLHAIKRAGGQRADLVALVDESGFDPFLQLRGASDPDGGTQLQRLNAAGALMMRPLAGLAVDFRGGDAEDLVVSFDTGTQVGLAPYVANANLSPELPVYLMNAPAGFTAMKATNTTWVFHGSSMLVGFRVTAFPRTGGSTTTWLGPMGGPSYSHLVSLTPWSELIGVTFITGQLDRFHVAVNDTDGGVAFTANDALRTTTGTALVVGPVTTMVAGDFRFMRGDGVPALVIASATSVDTFPLRFGTPPPEVRVETVRSTGIAGPVNDLALGDFNGDGLVDLAVALPASPGLRIVLGQGL
jgi:hypothetical protein